MTALNRRGWVAGVAAVAATPWMTPAAAQGQAMYDYVFFDLDGSPGSGPPANALAQQLRASRALAGAEQLGVFTPQLGWRSRQAAALLRWPDPAAAGKAPADDLAKLPGVRAVQRHRLTPTARPAPNDRLREGGIYVHRWFEIRATDLEEFVSLSVSGWRDFERRFDTNIFGLFAAEQTEAEKRDGLTRLLLMTRYRDHGVWEASRDPTTDAMAAFRRRQLLTRETWAASTLLLGPSA